MVNSNLFSDGALPVETRRAGQVPGPLPHEGPPLATGGRLSQTCGVRRLGPRSIFTDQSKSRKELNLLQWNAEGVFHKKLPLTSRLHAENIDIACIQETHLTANMRFNIRGYQSFRMDREGRHKGGTIILVKNSIPAVPFELNTGQEAEIQGVQIHTKENLTVYNMYCPSDKDLSLHMVNIPKNCIVLGDLNSHSTSWGYDETNSRGEEVEDWTIETKLILLNDPNDPPTFFSRRWRTTTTPDLAFATDDVSKLVTRSVLDQLGGSDHKPIKLSIDMNYKPDDSKTFPRWNYKRANWAQFSAYTDKYTKGIKENDTNINKITKCFNEAILRAAKQSIPRGARKNYKPYWTNELQEMEDDVTTARQIVEENPSIDNNILFKASEAKYRRSYKEAARKSWIEKTEKLNLDRDGTKLWKLAKSLNNETSRSASVTLEHNGNTLTGKQAADCFIDKFAEISNTIIPNERRQEVQHLRKDIQHQQETEENMVLPLQMSELTSAIKKLIHHKSPGPDKITNEMLENLGPKAKRKLLSIFNNSWKTGNIPQIWKDADMVPILKKDKDKTKPGSYRPISLTSCVGKLMERIVNSRLSWYLEKYQILVPEQAGFRTNRSTEDQVTYITQKIEDAFQEKKQTIAVWIDMAKAFDTVWKDGLKLKLEENGIKGNMMKWISQYLNNRTARVHSDGKYSHKRILKQGVPQGGVLSPTLFLIFINDIVKDLPKNIKTAMYADDLAIWCSQEYISTARYRVQLALDKLEKWTEQWLIKINESKTTYTIFSLSHKEQNVPLKINGQPLAHNTNPLYLGINFDRRLTWKSQISKIEKEAKGRLNLMKKLAGTTWGADARVLQTLYTGSVRPVLEYGISTWGTAAKSNFNKLNRVQNQASRIITGGMKSTPIHDLENHTGLNSLEDRHKIKVLTQAAKFKRLPDHPMKERMNQPIKGRLKRESFIHQSKAFEKKYDLTDQEPQQIKNHTEIPTWKRHIPLSIKLNVPNVGNKHGQTHAERRHNAIEHMNAQYPSNEWTRIYTDGSADKAIKNGGAGIFMTYPNREEEKYSVATGLHSSNYKAEAVALKTAITHLHNNPKATQNLVFLTDALSVLQSLISQNNDLEEIATALTILQRKHNVVLQWIPSHCNITGNEIADELAKNGSKLTQANNSITYKESKTIIKSTIHNEWSMKHPEYQKHDPYHQLSRSQQVTIFRLRTGHNRLNYHLCTKFKIGTRECPCGTGHMTGEHILQSCPTYDDLRKKHWPETFPPTMRERLFGGLAELQRTAAFVKETGLTM